MGGDRGQRPAHRGHAGPTLQGRGPSAAAQTFWSSWVIEGPNQKVFFSGDSGPHWGTFNLALHAWDEPIKRAIELAAKDGVQMLSPTLGQTVHRESGVAEFWRQR